MQSYWSKALAIISITLLISVSLAGCEPKRSYSPISDGGGTSTGSTSAGGGTSTSGTSAGVSDVQMEVFLSGLEQNLDLSISNMESAINLGNDQLARGLVPVNCTTTLVYQAQLQELVINGRLSSNNSTLVRIGKQITRLRSLSQCVS